MKVLYTNTASSVDSWITKAESTLASCVTKIVGVDVEYDKLTGSKDNPKKATVLQLCVGTDVLVYHIFHADEESEKLYQFLYGWMYTFASFCTVEDHNVLARSSLYIHNMKDIQTIWRDPDNKRKRLQGLKDVVAAIIDPIYFEMKDGFGRKEHRMWADPPPLPPKHLEYAARDAYAMYEVYMRLDVFERAFFSLYKHSEKKCCRDW
ncbi:hypothetical protein ACQ4PT_027381 [Festuca glaucescens]